MSKWNLKNTALKYVYAGLLALVALLQGCATANTGSIEHGIQPYNYGTIEIVDITVLYGPKTIKFAGVRPSAKPSVPNGGGTYGVWMPIPQQMTVTWHTEKDGPEHRVTIPLKDKVSSEHKLLNWEIRFFGNQIQLWREEATGPLNPHTMFWPREAQKFFPLKIHPFI